MSAKHLVYVHGICRHDLGYSDSWFAAMAPYVPSLAPGELSPVPGDLSKNRHEVIWSDLVNEPTADAVDSGTSVGASGRALDEGEVEQIRSGLLAELEQRQDAAVSEAQASAANAEMSAELGGVDFGIPGQDCIDDFAIYLASDELRDRVLARFSSIMIPLVSAGKQIEVISHSWGTVVAYEAMRRLEAAPPIGEGRVHNFFTVGSALAINFVNNRLLPEAADRRLPRLADRWVNVNAFGDFVGGSLTADDFELDEDHDITGLAAVGCGLIPSPRCAHSSYFDAENQIVNNEIFGSFVED